MKVALIGAGKTGGEVAHLHSDTTIFNSKNKPTVESLRACEVVIVFVPGDVFLEYIPMLIEAKLPVVIGATGFDWDQKTIKEIEKHEMRWVHSHNFSLGMSIMKSLIETLSKGSELLEDTTFRIHDIHHTKKLDAPSGTALSWKKWLGKDVKITSERTGDVVGYHHLEMESPNEKIKIIHEAKDRGIFARGALWTANQVLHNTNLPYGLTHFNDLVINQIKK